MSARHDGREVPTLTVDDGRLIELAPMKGMTIDAGRERAVAEPGLLWGEFDRATQEHGLATTGGMISHTGIAGLTLGSGFGWLMRNFALTHDNLVSVDL